MKLFFACLILFLAACQTRTPETPHTIEGEWGAQLSLEGKPFALLTRFKPDGVVDVMGNGKLIISQQYRSNGDSVIFSGDANCNPGSEGLYKLTFFQDSVRLNLLKDSCEMRIMNTDNVTLARVQKN